MNNLKHRLLLCMLCLASMSGLISPMVYGVTGNSIAYFEEPLINIPRIDVEGFGSLNLQLQLLDANALTFAVAGTADGDISKQPGASFDLNAQVLTIPVLRVGSEFYNVQMQLTSGDVLQVTVADEAVLVGQVSYDKECASCHGVDGQGGSTNIPMTNCAQCSGLDVLGNYISANMPLGAIGKCAGTCASDVADYILTAFNIGLSSQASVTDDSKLQQPLSELFSRVRTLIAGNQLEDGNTESAANTFLSSKLIRASKQGISNYHNLPKNLRQLEVTAVSSGESGSPVKPI